jgi:drug/metabolite transporter (DMT)-like permease
MEFGLLIAVIFGLALQNVTKKAFNSKVTASTPYIFTLISCVFACLFFVITSGFKLDFSLEVLPYSIGFGLSYGAAVIFTFLAVMTGPLSLSVLISSYSLMVPTVYGLIFLNETVSVWFYIGLFFLAVSLFLINFKSKEKKDNETGVKISAKWLLFVFLGFVGNGACSTIQVVQQKNLNGAYKNEFMILSLIIVIAAITVLIAINERKSLLGAVKGGGIYAAICGTANGICNLFVMMLAVRMNASLMYPLISAGSIIVTAIVSIFFYKERLSRLQLSGLVLGICAVIFMNI